MQTPDTGGGREGDGGRRESQGQTGLQIGTDVAFGTPPHFPKEAMGRGTFLEVDFHSDLKRKCLSHQRASVLSFCLQGGFLQIY